LAVTHETGGSKNLICKNYSIYVISSIDMVKSSCKKGGTFGCYSHHTLNDIQAKQVFINKHILNNETTEWRLDSKVYESIKEELKDKEKQLLSTANRLDLHIIEQFGSALTPICECCFINLYQIKSRTFERTKSLQKKRIIIENHTETVKKLVNKHNRKSDVMNEPAFATLPEARKYFNKNSGIVMSEFEIKSSCVPNTPAAIECFVFLNEFFDLNCDYPPNKNDTTCELPGSMYTKKSIYKIFQKHCCEDTSRESTDYYLYSSFCKMWTNIFPNVVIKKYLSVAGKCKECLEIYKLEEQATNNSQRESIKLLKHYHRLFVMQQKLQYYENRRKAIDSPNEYMSIIFDGMSSNHTLLPHHADQKVSTNQVVQHIQGVKIHGLSRVVYRSFPHISNGFNVAAHVLIHEIKRNMEYCLKENLPFPHTLFIQSDGGAENTAQAMFGLIELLHEFNVFETIEFNRLPVGHTHEDIDAMFGTIC